MDASRFSATLAWRNSFAPVRARLSFLQDILAAALILGVFLLQVWYLREAAAPVTDEGVYAEAGRLMLSGKLPHRDFGFWHMPGLPLVIGLGLKIFHSIYPVRIFHLLCSCLTAGLVYLSARKVTGSRLGSLLALVFCLSFHEMQHHDARFLAVRQLSNVFVAGYLWLSLGGGRAPTTRVAQSILAMLAALTFLPALPTLAMVACAAILSESDRVRRAAQLRSHSIAVGSGVIAALLYLLAVPGAFRQVVLDQAARAGTERLARFGWIISSDKDGFLYGLSLCSLGFAIVLLKGKLRWYGLAMAGIAAMSTLLASNFYPHYPVAGAIGWLLGIALSVRLLEGLVKPQKYSWVVALFFLLGSFIQLRQTATSLLDEWLNNRQPLHHELVAAISRQGGPLLSVQPIYAVESGVELVYGIHGIAFRPPVYVKDYGDADYADFERQACTILLERWAEMAIPESIRKGWLEKYPVVVTNPWGTLLATHHSGCDGPAAGSRS